MLRPHVEFDTTIPYDGIEDEDGWVRQPGKSIAKAMQGLIAQFGGYYVGPLVDEGDHGWGFYFVYGKSKLSCDATMIDRYVVSFRDASILRGLFKRTGRDYVAFLRRIAEAIAEDPRFQEVVWLADHEVGAADVLGAARPVED